ncbi:DNA-binding transcriptional regulator LsrR (DeoR family) [Motilibacter peucedani]|uniref:DNA-binding transcriptional regulator LsrR (DeoR family) n=1 Tax=Motilibacter peucedani TaxID=598650 RepID=A0A420XK53_9ACTN|nr:sugar-binding domain-containing protein [Motilibacter peucedani]RKS68502.1 DNA-binding transcriptional regulator LsrR (DeoR family) [Motilibacter peucedani]
MSVPGPSSLVLTASVARRYYLDGRSKIEIAEEFGLSRFKVARLIDTARSTGLVRIEFHFPGELDLDLSSRLQTAFGLRHSVVVDSPEDDPEVLRQHLGRAAADLLSEVVTAEDVLGLAWARSLMAMRTALTSLAPCEVVQLTGALSRPDVDESAIELVRDVARKGNGPAFFFYAPMILPDAATAAVLRRQLEIERAMKRYPRVTVAVVGVGSWEPRHSTVVDALTPAERREIRALGVRAELSGIQIDEQGDPVATPLTDRTIGITAEQLRAVPDVVGIVYDSSKAAAVRAALRGGYLKSLVTHASMARELLAGADDPR